MTEHKVEIFKQNPYGEEVKEVSDNTKDETDKLIDGLPEDDPTNPLIHRHPTETEIESDTNLSTVKDETDYSQPVTVPDESPFADVDDKFPPKPIIIPDEVAQQIAEDINKMTKKPLIADTDKTDLEKISESQYILLAHKIRETETLILKLKELTHENDNLKAENDNLKDLLKSYEDVINHTMKIKESEPKEPVKEKLSVRIKNRFKRKKEEREEDDRE